MHSGSITQCANVKSDLDALSILALLDKYGRHGECGKR